MIWENCGMELQDPHQNFCPNCGIPLRKNYMKLESEESYILISDNLRKIYLWKGLKSSVRSRFIGARRAQEIRDKLGVDYSMKTVREGQEDPEFLKIIGILEEVDSDDLNFNKDGSSPFPFIPPSPPGDFGAVEQISLQVVNEGDAEDELYCKHCGSDLQEGQSLCHVCGKKVI